MNAVLKPCALRAALPDRPPSIVVIDDSRASLALYRRSFERLDAHVSLFESPREGFGYLERNDADLVFLGNLMRETDGMTLLRRLRGMERHAETAVVIVSTKDYAQDRATARELGALEYLTKPVRSQEIREVITKYTPRRVPEHVAPERHALKR